jgi:hypothetical protein
LCRGRGRRHRQRAGRRIAPAARPTRNTIQELPGRKERAPHAEQRTRRPRSSTAAPTRRGKPGRGSSTNSSRSECPDGSSHPRGDPSTTRWPRARGNRYRQLAIRAGEVHQTRPTWQPRRATTLDAPMRERRHTSRPHGQAPPLSAPGGDVRGVGTQRRQSLPSTPRPYCHCEGAQRTSRPGPRTGAALSSSPIQVWRRSPAQSRTAPARRATPGRRRGPRPASTRAAGPRPAPPGSAPRRPEPAERRAAAAACCP